MIDSVDRTAITTKGVSLALAGAFSEVQTLNTQHLVQNSFLPVALVQVICIKDNPLYNLARAVSLIFYRRNLNVIN